MAQNIVFDPMQVGFAYMVTRPSPSGTVLLMVGRPVVLEELLPSATGE